MGAVEMYDAGFTALVSVVPPGAEIKEGSTLSPDDAGKVPGIKGHSGKYHGYNWMASRPSRENVAIWKHQGSSIGFLASHYPAIDVDIMDEDLAAAVVEAVEKRVGKCLVRTGQHPKKLIIFRCDEELRSFDMHYSKWSDLLGAEDKQLIQFLAKGRQYVMDGIHPRTGEPYYVDDPNFALMLGPASLPTLTPDLVIELFQIIGKVMSAKGYETHSSPEARLTGGDVDQDGLKAPDATTLRDLVDRLPNDVPDRDDYILVGYAIKAASQDDPEAGFDAFWQWCARWTQGYNDPETVRRDWDKMVPPYRSGYDWLLYRAREWSVDVSDLQFGKAEPRPAEATPAEPGLPPAEDPEITASRQALNQAAESAQFSDEWLAKQFLGKHGKDYLLPRGLPKTCYQWNGKQWEPGHVEELAYHISQFLVTYTSMARQSFENPRDGAAMAMRLGSAGTMHSVVTKVKSAPALRVSASELDQNPDLLNTPDGPIHLPTGKLQKAERQQYQTKCTRVRMDPTAHCPRWLKFIEESTNGDASLAFYLQCLAGYALTGHTREQVFPFFVGSGGNGKSVFVNTISRIMGEYATSVPVELFQAGRQNHDTPYQLARLQGARLVTTSETKAGGMWDEQRVKQITGEDNLVARLPFGDPFEFSAQCTLIVVGNYNPDLESVTDAMSRRIKVVPWDHKPEAPDLHLDDKLALEWPGILAWCVQGAVAWYQHGLPNAAAVRDETQAYLEDQDTLGQWMRDCLAVSRDDQAFVSNRDLFDSYMNWCRIQGINAIGQRQFSQRLVTPLRTCGALRTRTRGARGWRRLTLKQLVGAPTNVVNFPAVAELPPRG